MIDIDWLPPTWRTERTRPAHVIVSFYASGQLRNVTARDLIFEISDGIAEGRITFGKSGWENYDRDGTVERYNRFSDGEKPEPMDFEIWARECIAWIAKHAG